MTSLGPDFRLKSRRFQASVTNPRPFRFTSVERKVDHARRNPKSTLFNERRQTTVVRPAPFDPLLSPLWSGRLAH